MKLTTKYLWGVLVAVSALLALFGIFELCSLAHFKYRLNYEEGTAFSRTYVLAIISLLGGALLGGIGIVLFQVGREARLIAFTSRASAAISIAALLFLFISPGRMSIHSIVSALDMCINNQREIEAAKSEWAEKNGATNGTELTWNDISPYLTNGIPNCPAGGTYRLGRIGEPVSCSIPNHRLPAK